MQRFGTPENIAGLVSYLVSDEADYITGAYCAFPIQNVTVFTLRGNRSIYVNQWGLLL